jgi:hypothetical protein
MAGPAQRFEADRTRFPGMLLREILIWKNWLYQNSTRFDRYEYNVRLGEGVDPGPSYNAAELSDVYAIRRQWVLNSMKRADVVAVRGGHVTIIEVEDNPGLSAFGQLTGYLALWRSRVTRGGSPDVHKTLGVEDFFPADLPLDRDPKALLVCARCGNDALAVAASSGVQVEVIPTDFTPLKAQK